MARPLLFDTCAAIWFMEDAPFSTAASRAVADALRAGLAIAVSPISAWEIGLLVSKKRLRLGLDPIDWIDRMLDEPGMRLADLPPRVLIESSRLPGIPPKDPADRIIASTAREYGMCVVTRDRALTAYARSGHIDLIVC
jgi:PIN domain nuclease of toxin-antitoxin system